MSGAVANPLAMDDAVHGPNRPVVAKAAGPSAPPAASVHVLLVDDERLTRTVVANLLHKCGYRVTSASDGMEALQLLRNSAPDTFQLVLTDVCMPELNGIELLSCVKQDASLRAVPVVMMSSVDQEETVAECVQQGAEEYLVKPVTRKEVQHIWQHVWRKRCAAATVPQLPQEAAAAVAAAAAAAASHQQQQRQAAAAAAAARGLAPGAQDAQLQPSTSSGSGSQQQELVQQLGSCIDLLIRSSLHSAAGSLLQRQSAFTAAVNLVQAAHLQQRALLCLRPTQLLFCEQHGLTAARAADGGSAEAAGPGNEVDCLYVSPEEAAGSPSCQSDIFSLGLLFVDLFFPCASQEQRCAQLRAARTAVLPPVLAGTHTAGSPQAVQDLLHGLLQADPARRPTVHAIIRAGILQDAYRLVQQLPLWRLLPPLAPAAAEQQQLQLQQQQQQQQQQQRLIAPAASGPAASAAPRPAQLPPRPRMAAVPGGVDHDAVRHFLLLLRKSKQQELAEAQAKLAALEVDLLDAAGRRRRQSSPSAVASSLGQPRQLEAEAGAVEQPPPSKRTRLSADEPAYASADGAAAAAAPPLEQQQRLAAVMPKLEEVFFQRRQQQQRAAAAAAAAAAPAAQPAVGVTAAAAPPAAAGEAAAGSCRHLEAFARDLNELAAHSKLELKATLRSGDLASPVEMACCAAFDRDDEFFATVGVSRRVKIFDFAACLEGGDSVMHYPALQITTRSKLSSVCWNSYVKSQLITSDYSGLIQLWDASTAAEVAQYDEHARRVWSVDFSLTDPMRFLSGSDDGSVRLWSVHEQSSVSRITAPANVCSVQFSPTDSHTIAFGCANYRVYLYDLRHTAHPLSVICGPQRAVSYVRFLGGSHLVSASTDSALRLWDLRDMAPVAAATSSAGGATSGGATSGGNNGGGGNGGGASGGRCRPAVTYTGHRNQRNFVGLSVSPDGRILCGSEDNSVHCYSRSLPFSTARYSFAPPEAPAPAGGAGEAHQPFVSAVCWANRSRHCLAANSQGLLQILELE